MWTGTEADSVSLWPCSLLGDLGPFKQVISGVLGFQSVKSSVESSRKCTDMAVVQTVRRGCCRRQSERGTLSLIQG